MESNMTLYARRPRSVDLLDRMLNHTTLTTKKVTHNHILAVAHLPLLQVDLGSSFVKRSTVDTDAIHKQAAKEAKDAAEQRHIREIRAALNRQEKEMEADKLRSLENQKMFYNDLAKRVAFQKDRAEEERVKQLKRQFQKEKQLALENQWREAETLKDQAVEEAIGSLRKKMRDEYAMEKERAIAEALSKARDKFREREKEAIKQTRFQCEREAAVEVKRIIEIHNGEVTQMRSRLSVLEEAVQKEVNKRKVVEGDYVELEQDYKRFMDYTDGKFHSDYLMQLRLHGATFEPCVATKQTDVLGSPKDLKKAVFKL